MPDLHTDKQNNAQKAPEQFNLTWLNPGQGFGADTLAAELADIGVGDYARQHMSAKGDFYVLRAEGLRTPAANILKQEFLAKGAEAAVHPQVITGGIERSAAVMLATAAQYERICQSLRRQQFGLPQLAAEIEAALANIRLEEWQLPLAGGRQMRLSCGTQIMGILNVTPDSFSDGGSYASCEAAVERALAMQAEGAYIIDVGGESTRPGHEQISCEEEIRRVAPVIEALRRRSDVLISVDTYKAAVARAALAAGADIINDIWGLQYAGDPEHEMAALAAAAGCPVIAMHNQEGTVYGGRSRDNIRYDMMSDVALFFRRAKGIAAEAGMRREQLIFDIGFGFGKDALQNMEVLAKAAALRVLGRPLLVAASRKSTLGLLSGRPVGERQFATAATTAAASLAGAALVRVHDVSQAADVLSICRPMYRIRRFGTGERH